MIPVTPTAGKHKTSGKLVLTLAKFCVVPPWSSGKVIFQFKTKNADTALHSSNTWLAHPSA